MLKIYKKLLFLFVLILFFSAAKTAVFAAELEVDYPVLPTGATITSSSELTEYLKYVFDFGIAIGFIAILISLAYAGVLYFLSPAIPEALAKAKDRVSGAISGLLILVLFYLIITTINPYLAIFKLGKLEPVDIPEPEIKNPGVTFHKSAGCAGESKIYTSSLSDLGDDLRNNVFSVGMEQDTKNKIAYVSILYDITNFWGKCQYVDPNKECSNVEKFASSASVHQYNFFPDGNGVYIYQSAFTKGGYLHITNSQIANAKILILDLKKLRFTGESSNYEDWYECTAPTLREGCFPKDEEYDCSKPCPKGRENCPWKDKPGLGQDCIQYNEEGKCTFDKCPNLSGKNISSIKIDGDYAVLLVYFAPGDPAYGPWTYCQEYASSGDINKIGPQNIKWDAVRSRNQDPNFMIIIPIKR